MKLSEKQIKCFRILLALLAIFMVTPSAAVLAAVSLGQTVSATTGAADAKTITLPSWSPGSYDLVLVSVAVKPYNRAVTVSGNGLTFVEIANVKNVQDVCSLRLFRAMGAAPSSGSITVSFFDLQNNAANTFAAASASRFAGVDSGGANGHDAIEATATGPGPVSDNNDMKVAITSVTDHAWLFAAGTYRMRTLQEANLPSGQTVIVKDQYGGSAGDVTSVATWRKQDVHPPATVTMGADNTMSSDSDWAIVAVSIKAGTGGGGGSSLAASPASLNLFVGSNNPTIVSGGTPAYTAVSANPSIATVTVNQSTMTVTGVAVGSTTLTITDSLGQTLSVAVSVAPTLIANPASLAMAPTEQQTFTISGGVAGYTVSSGNVGIATITVSGTTVTVTAVAAGTTAINIVDHVGSSIQVPVYVGTISDPGLPGCPIPPFATAGVGPNVMMILDNSGSMGSGPGSKWENAKAALKDIVTNNPNIRFGLMRLDRQDGHRSGKVLVPCGFKGTFPNSAGYIVNYITSYMPNNKAPDPESQTNLAQTLAAAGQYFATVQKPDGTRVGMRVGDSATSKLSTDFGYYKRDNNYTYIINGVKYDAATTDDFGHTIDTTSPIKYSCEKSFIIFLTDGMSFRDDGWDVVEKVIGDYDGDGEEAKDCWGWKAPFGPPPHPTNRQKCDEDPSVKGSTYMDDVAKYLYDSDLRSDIEGKQNILTYTVAFGFGAGENTALLEDTAAKGGGLFFAATNDTAQLTEVLQTQIADINAKVSSGTAVAVISTEAASDDYMIRARVFTGNYWKGYLERFTLPYDSAAYPPQAADWEAGALLNSRVASLTHADRSIYTFMAFENPKKQLFTTADPVKTRMQVLWSQSASETNDIINYIRGDTTYDGGKYKDRSHWLLGDIVYSSPLTVGGPKGWYFAHKPSDPPEYASYQTFKDANSGRKTMIYVGANDGMLHAFDAANGHEDWAFIPESIQGSLKDLTEAGCHKYYVDLSPYVADAWDASANKWKTVLIGGDRLGGPEYFALDVTDPSSNGFAAMWDVVPFALGENKHSTTMPSVGKVKSNGGSVDDWVAIITSGYQQDTTYSGKIAVLKISDGQKAAIWDVNGDGHFGTYATTQNKSAGSPYYTMSSPAALDSDMDGYVDLIYAGDTEGTLWKFYYDYEHDSWKKVALFTGAAPITATPALAVDSDGNLRVYFGSGSYIEETDKTTTARNALYCVVEKKQANGHYTGATQISKDDLADLTSAVTKAQFDALADAVKVNATSYGWYFKLDSDSLTDPLGRPAERILGKPLVISGQVFFTSFVPSGDVCGYGGTARLYAVDYIYGVVNEPALADLAHGQKYMDIGAGVPSEPVYYFDPETKQAKLFIQKSDANVADPSPILKERPMLIRSWRAR